MTKHDREMLNNFLQEYGELTIRFQSYVDSLQRDQEEQEEQEEPAREETISNEANKQEETIKPATKETGQIPWGKKVDEDFIRSVLWIEDQIGLRAEYLMTVMAFETGRSFRPDIKNPRSSATGLIQFMEATAKRLGTTTVELREMTAVQQLAYVYKYFKQFGNDLSGWNLGDTYFAVLWPAGIGKDNYYKVFIDNPKRFNDAYDANKGLDLNKDGFVTRKEVLAKIYKIWEEGFEQTNVREWRV